MTEIGQVFHQLPPLYKKGSVGESLVYYFSIEDEHYTVTLNPDTCEVVEGKSTDNANCFLKTSKDIFLKTFRGEYTPSMTDLIMGKVKTNNPILMQTFLNAFRQ